MSSLNSIDRKLLEQLLGMSGGFVLDFSDVSYASFFRDFEVDISEPAYLIYGASKAKRMRAYWDRSSDEEVAKVLQGLFNYIELTKPAGAGGEVDSRHLAILTKLQSCLDKKDVHHDVKEFLATRYADSDITALSLDFSLAEAIKQRLNEINICLHNDAPLALILLAGSTLEALLLNAACAEPELFNRSKAAPMHSERVKRLHDWSLSDLINVAYEVGLIGLDVKTYSHGLRDFRNFIHPYEQAKAAFRPDGHTARISLQVLRAAIADLGRSDNP